MTPGPPAAISEDQRNLDDRDGRSHKGSERLARAVSNDLGVMNSCEDGTHQNCCDNSSEDRPGRELAQREHQESRDRNHRGPPRAKHAGHGPDPRSSPEAGSMASGGSGNDLMSVMSP
jgi:hypothetical protein